MKTAKVTSSPDSSSNPSPRVDTDGKNTAAEKEVLTINLKNRYIALLLAWLVPGLGHLYQGRITKAIIFGVPILLLLFLGFHTGTYYPVFPDGEKGPARYASCVYCDFPSGTGGLFQKLAAGRLYFIPQAACAVAALPACLQTSRFNSDKPLLFNGAFAPPARDQLGKEYTSTAKNPQLKNPSFDDIILALGGWFDIGTIYVAVAGLLNVLAMFDAFAGPVLSAAPERKSDEEETEEE